jgi:hypothetical protein
MVVGIDGVYPLAFYIYIHTLYIYLEPGLTVNWW